MVPKLANRVNWFISSLSSSMYPGKVTAEYCELSIFSKNVYQQCPTINAFRFLVGSNIRVEGFFQKIPKHTQTLQATANTRNYHSSAHTSSLGSGRPPHHVSQFSIIITNLVSFFCPRYLHPETLWSTEPLRPFQFVSRNPLVFLLTYGFTFTATSSHVELPEYSPSPMFGNF